MSDQIYTTSDMDRRVENICFKACIVKYRATMYIHILITLYPAFHNKEVWSIYLL